MYSLQFDQVSRITNVLLGGVPEEIKDSVRAMLSMEPAVRIESLQMTKVHIISACVISYCYLTCVSVSISIYGHHTMITCELFFIVHIEVLEIQKTFRNYWNNIQSLKYGLEIVYQFIYFLIFEISMFKQNY